MTTDGTPRAPPTPPLQHTHTHTLLTAFIPPSTLLLSHFPDINPSLRGFLTPLDEATVARREKSEIGKEDEGGREGEREGAAGVKKRMEGSVHGKTA